MNEQQELDYNQEAHRLFSAFGLDGSRSVSSYHDMDKIWVDRSTGGAIYVGNETAAKGPMEELNRRNITHVVNCTDDMPNFLEGNGPEYFRFNVARHHHICTTPQALSDFVGELFSFIDAALAKGASVLVHCLAGAHRAGTTGCLLLMHKEGFGVDDAVRAAQALRPVINPIGHLPLLLERFDQMRQKAHETVWQEAEEARRAQEARVRAKQADASRYVDADSDAGPTDDDITIDAPLTQVLSVLSHISRRADRARRSVQALMSDDESARYYDDDDFEDDDDEDDDSDGDDDSDADDADGTREESPTRQQPQEEEPPVGRTPMRGTYEDDLLALKAAVNASRQAVRDVEDRLATAEAEEPARDAYVRSPMRPLAASVAAALGVPQEAAERALFSTGSLEEALELLEQRQ